MIFNEKQKTHPIERGEVWEAFKEVRAGGESPGVDGITIVTVAGKPRKYLYPVWNRLASGSYYPQAVRQAERINSSIGGLFNPKLFNSESGNLRS